MPINPLDLNNTEATVFPGAQGDPSVRVVAVSMVKNEGDIISFWASHVAALFDRVYVVDHSSSDGTRDFLQEIAEAFPAFKVFSFSSPGYFQAEIMNRLAGIAARECPEAWIVPLDADEFLPMESKESLLALLAPLKKNHIPSLNWRNCIPLSPIFDETLLPVSVNLISPTLSRYEKVGLHASAFTALGYRFSQGNHDVESSSLEPTGGPIKVNLGELFHVPLRSIDHFTLKCMQGCIAYNALPRERRLSGQGFHWFEMMNQALRGKAIGVAELRHMAADYGSNIPPDKPYDNLYSLLREGWTCNALNIRYVSNFPRNRRNKRFRELAGELITHSPDSELKAFYELTESFLGPELSGHAREIEICANKRFLPELPTAEHPPIPMPADLDFLSDFQGPAFTPQQTPTPSAWRTHVPFLFCLFRLARPRRFVELGAHHGNCFFAACQASRGLSSLAECFAIDTWQGDDHAGAYGEQVFQEFKSILKNNYPSCGKYLRMTFDEANKQFADRSIDLLHIDGLHTYEAVSHDFETWLPKMSDEGIILFHDTTVYERGFGVWKFWSEIESQYPSFEFEHGHGLGLILVGTNARPQVRRLFELLAQDGYSAYCRKFFSEVGEISPISAHG